MALRVSSGLYIDFLSNVCYNEGIGCVFRMYPSIIKREVIVIKRQSKLLYESANILCWFRIIASLVLAIITTRRAALAILFALAFLSDAIDGWCYRKFASDKPYQHWFNRLPMSMDPIADSFFGICGVIHVMDDKLLGLKFAIILVSVNFILKWLGENGSDLLSAVALTTLTYYWFVLMVIVTGGVWLRNCAEHGFIGFAITMIIFYAVWLKTRVKSRTIRKRG